MRVDEAVLDADKDAGKEGEEEDETREDLLKEEDNSEDRLLTVSLGKYDLCDTGNLKEGLNRLVTEPSVPPEMSTSNSTRHEKKPDLRPINADGAGNS